MNYLRHSTIDRINRIDIKLIHQIHILFHKDALASKYQIEKYSFIINKNELVGKQQYILYILLSAFPKGI